MYKQQVFTVLVFAFVSMTTMVNALPTWIRQPFSTKREAPSDWLSERYPTHNDVSRTADLSRDYLKIADLLQNKENMASLPVIKRNYPAIKLRKREYAYNLVFPHFNELYSPAVQVDQKS